MPKGVDFCNAYSLEKGHQSEFSSPFHTFIKQLKSIIPESDSLYM